MSVTLEMTADDARVERSIAKLSRQVDDLKTKLRDTAKTSKRGTDEASSGFDRMKMKVRDALNPAHLASFTAGLIGGGGVLGAINLVNRGYDTWLRNMREISAANRKLVQDSIAFAALQEGGTKAARVREVAALASSYGVTDTGAAYNTVQSLQSIRGGYGAGVNAARTVFAATQVGIPIALGSELEVQGAAQGAAPGQFSRMAFAAGQASGRDPETLAKAAASLLFFQNKRQGFATAGVLADTFGGELDTYVKAAGVGLQDVGDLGGFFAGAGVTGGDPIAKLKALSAAGIVSPEDFTRAGVGEMRRAQALSTLVGRVGDVERISSAIGARAVPGLFASQRAGIEAEIPAARLERQIRMAEAMFTEATALSGTGAMQQELRDRALGLALRRTGTEQNALGMDTIDAQGMPTLAGQYRATDRGGRDFPIVGDLLEILFGQHQNPVANSQQEILRELRQINANTSSNAAGLIPTGFDQ